MRMLMGIAPSQASIYDADGYAAPWCEAADSGRKVRRLTGAVQIDFANASNTRPRTYMNKREQRIDKEPSTTTGYERLCGLAEAATPEAPVQILLLGLNYWKDVGDMAARLGRLKAPRYDLPVARAMSFTNAKGFVTATLTFFPHPRNWPQHGRMTREQYRSALLAALQKQEIKRSRKASVSLRAEDYEMVLAEFGL